MKFKNREEAAKLLIPKLTKFKGQNPLILGIPRGAMPMAKLIATTLQGELSAILVHKIPHPNSEEFAIASVSLSGHIITLPYVEQYRVSKSYLESEAKEQLERLKDRQKKFGLSEPQYNNRLIIIVDDGIATGATILGAIDEVRRQHPKKLILAAAVCAPDTAKKLRPLVDEFIVLSVPNEFYAVGEFFENFSQVTDEDVIRILQPEFPLEPVPTNIF